jgi:parallel beta-helix repeat protein
MRSVPRYLSGRFAARTIAMLLLLIVGAAALVMAQAPPSIPQGLIARVGSSTTGPINVTVTPASITVMAGATVQFSAVVAGSSSTSVVWSASTGSISTAGSYTAPQPAGTYTITATVSGGTASRSATVTIDPSQAYVSIAPGEDIQSRVNATPAGAAFRLQAGIHRMQSITPRNGDTFEGETGTVLSGARVLTMGRSGQYWVANGQTQQGDQQGVCRVTVPQCGHPEDLFIDNVPLLHVGSLAAVGAGKWFFDYAAGQIYIGDDPTGHSVETSVTPLAFVSEGSNVTGVTISGLTIEKYANPGNKGAINAPNGHWWTVSNNEIRLNHATGVAVGTGSQVIDNNTHHNGQVGIGGYDASDVVIQGNEIAYNGAIFDSNWGAGGLKIAFLSDTVVRDNFSHHNFGGGMWCDIDCSNVVFEDNTVEDNQEFGIFYEIGFNGIIRNNSVSRNGFSVTEGPAQAGIFVAASANVEIYANTLTANASGIVAYQENRGTSPAYGVVWAIENLNVHDNSLTMAVGVNGLIQTINDPTFYTSRNNRFSGNHYQLGSATPYFYWMDSHRSDAEWQAYGLDATGTISH